MARYAIWTVLEVLVLLVVRELVLVLVVVLATVIVMVLGVVLDVLVGDVVVRLKVVLGVVLGVDVLEVRFVLVEHVLIVVSVRESIVEVVFACCVTLTVEVSVVAIPEIADT